MRYKVDLKGFMAECETNYFRLHKLFPLLAEDRELHIATSPRNTARIVVAMLETTPFTTLLGIRQEGGGSTEQIPWLVAPALRVRLYHDAKLAEVVACDRVTRVWPRHHYPNERMFQPDEKAQWNRFLGEWLAALLDRGYRLIADCDPADSTHRAGALARWRAATHGAGGNPSPATKVLAARG